MEASEDFRRCKLHHLLFGASFSNVDREVDSPSRKEKKTFSWLALIASHPKESCIKESNNYTTLRHYLHKLVPSYPQPAISISAFHDTLWVWTIPATPSRTMVEKTSSPFPGYLVLSCRCLHKKGSESIAGAHLQLLYKPMIHVWFLGWDFENKGQNKRHGFFSRCVIDQGVGRINHHLVALEYIF